MALNLLHRPLQARRRRLQRRVLWTTAMTALGASLAWAAAQARLQDLPALQQQMADAQALQQRQTRQDQTLQAMRQDLRQLAAQQSAHEHVQQALQADAQVLQVVADLLPSGVVLERLVFERGRVEWQGQAPSAQSLHALHDRLNRQDARAWTLVQTGQATAAATEAASANEAQQARKAVRFTLRRSAPAEAAP